MPLLDHFHPPLSVRRHWHAFHNAWATYLSSALNQRLPQGYFAEANVQFGIEIDVATFEESTPPSTPASGSGWTPPEPVHTVPFSPTTETVEVIIFSSTAGPTLAGAIELVSPANKDRPAHREAFVSKCETYLRRGVGLVVVDVVTERGGNLHEELMARLRAPVATPPDATLSATGYRAVQRGGQPSLDIWQQTLTVGCPLPTMPLWLRGGLCLPVELDATYDRTCREQRVTDIGA